MLFFFFFFFFQAEDGIRDAQESRGLGDVYKRQVYTTTSNIKENILDQFITHNQVWSMYCLSPNEMQFPDDTYMKSEPVINIISGAGGNQNIKGRRVTTAVSYTHLTLPTNREV